MVKIIMVDNTCILHADMKKYYHSTVGCSVKLFGKGSVEFGTNWTKLRNFFNTNLVSHSFPQPSLMMV